MIALTKVDFLGDLVISELNKAITNELDAVIVLDSLSGNPITGFKTKEVVLSRSEDKLLTINKVEIDLSIISIIKNSPRISLLTLDGLKSDYESINKLIPKTKAPSMVSADIPIDKIEILSSEIKSPWGTLKSTKSSVIIKSLHWLNIDFKGSFEGKKLSMVGIVKKENGDWGFKGSSVGFENGKVSIDGAVYPNIDFKLNTNNLDLGSLFSLIPTFNTYGIKGFLTASASVKGSGLDMETQFQGRLKDAIIKTIPLSEVKVNGSYNKGLLNVELEEGHVFKSSLNGKIILDSREKIHNLELELSAKNLNFTDWSDKLTKGSKIKSVNLSGGISSMKANIKGPVNALVGKVEIAPSNIKYSNLNFNDFRGTATFNGTPYGTVDFSTIHNGKTTSLKGKISLSQNTNTNLILSIPALSLKELATAVPSLQAYDLAGTAKADVFIEGVTGDWLTKEGITGNWLTKVDLSIPSLFAKKEIEIKNIKVISVYSFKNQQLQIKNASAAYKDAQITASGTINDINTKNTLNLSGSFKNADSTKFYDLVPFFKDMNMKTIVFGTWTAKGTLQNPVISAKVLSNGAEFRNMKVDKFVSDISYSNNELVFSPINITGYGGTTTMTAAVSLARLRNDGTRTPVMWNLNGKLNKVNVAAINGILNSKEIFEGKVTAKFDVHSNERELAWNAKIEEGNATWKEFSAKSLKGTVSGTASNVKIDNLSAEFLHGNALVNGNVKLAPQGKPGKEAILDLKIKTNELNLYELIRKHLPGVRGVQGLLKGEIFVKGPATAPTYSGKATFAPLRYRDFYLPIVNLDFVADYNKFHVTKANAILKDGSIIGSGKIYKNDKVWQTILDIKGDRVDLKQFGAYLPENIRDRLGGHASFRMNGSGKLGAFAGKGNVTTNWMRIMGIKFTNVNAPFYVADGYAVMEDVKTVINGGTLAGGIALDLKNSVWGGNLTALDVNIDTTIKQFMPNLKGEVTGKADLKIRGEGEAGRLSTVNASGVILMKNGVVSGFDAVEAAKKYTSGKPLRFESIQTFFTFDAGDITILPGSQALAPEGDSVYQSIMLDGIVNRKKEVAMFVMGKVNIRALNAFLGTLQGVMSAGADLTAKNMDSSDLLKSFLGGVLSGYSKTGFSFITMNINGTVGALKYSNIKVDKNSGKSQSIKNIPRSDSDPEDRTIFDGNTKIKLKFEIPVGPGKNKTPNNIKDQVVEQTLENLLNNFDFGL